MDPTIFLNLEVLQRQCVIAFIMLLINIVTHCTILCLKVRSDPKPYHTSILTGTRWILELLLGHPNHIHNELGVCKHVFVALVNEHCSMDYGDN